MKNILKIYKRDMKSIFTNWVALIIAIALTILPALYAWFNIKADWDPYGNTNGIQIAVINNDKGGTLEDKKINLGEQVVDSLKENTALGWNFVSEKEAKDGLEKETYYASIEIPKDFTKDLLTMTTGDIVKPKLKYTLNQKINPIAPKITDKGVTSIQEQISSQVVETVDGIIFKIADELGIKVLKAKPDVEKLVDLIYKLNEKMPEIEDLINKASDGLITGEDLVNKINELVPTLNDTITKSQDILTKGEDYLNKIQSTINELEPVIEQDLNVCGSVSQDIYDLVNSINYDETSEEQLKQIITFSKTSLENIDTKVQGIKNIIDYINNIINSNKLTEISNRFNETHIKLNDTIKVIDKVLNETDNNGLLTKEFFNEVKSKIGEVNNKVLSLNSDFNNVILPEIQSGITKINNISDNGLTALKKIDSAMPQINNIVGTLGSGIELGKDKLQEVKEILPEVKTKLSQVVEKIDSVNDEEKIDEVLDLLINDWKTTSSFLGDPVEIEKNTLYPIPNFGSELSPFFTSLSIWVGGYLLVAIFSVKTKKFDDGEEIKPIEEYFGKLMLFITIGIVQALIVTLGDIFMLGVYLIHPVLFVISSIFISIVFTTIVYTLVSVFGNLGKAIGIIFLVLQSAASGGTFPVEVMPKFFQIINPFLPFKYSVGIMRELAAGINKGMLLKDILMLFVFLVVFLVIGVALKGVINKGTKKISDRWKESSFADK